MICQNIPDNKGRILKKKHVERGSSYFTNWSWRFYIWKTAGIWYIGAIVYDGNTWLNPDKTAKLEKLAEKEGRT